MWRSPSTGVAGPDPDEDGNPVGLVCIAVVPMGQNPEVIEKRYEMAAPRERIQEWAMAEPSRRSSGSPRQRKQELMGWLRISQTA